MSDKKNLNESQAKIHLSESEVLHLLQEAAQQYEEYIRLADLADIADQRQLSYPKYDWDNPIGFAVTE